MAAAGKARADQNRSSTQEARRSVGEPRERRARADRTGQGNSGWRWEWEPGQATQRDGILAGFRGRRDFLLKKGQASKVNSYSKLVAIADGWIKQLIMLDTRNCT